MASAVERGGSAGVAAPSLEGFGESRASSAPAGRDPLLRRFGAPLFPPATGSPRRWRSAAAGVAGITILMAASLLRQGGTAAYDSIWAEDGAVFYAGSFQHNVASVIFQPYNGYLHILPRVLIEIVRIFPLADAALAISAVGAATTSCLALLVYVASREYISRRILRVAIAAPIALPWVAQWELGNNIAAIHLDLLVASFWLALWNPGTRGRQAIAATVLFCATASDPLAAVYLPLLWLRCRLVAGRRGWLPLAALGAGLLLQIAGVFADEALGTRRVPARYDPAWASGGYSDNVVGEAFFKLYNAGDTVALGGVLVGWGVVVLVGVCAAIRVTNPKVHLGVVALFYSVTLYAALAMQGGSLAPRYAPPAIALLIAATAAFADSDERRRRLRFHVAASVPTVAVSAMVALCVVVGYRMHGDTRTTSVSWRSQISQAGAACAADPSAALEVIEIAPAHVWKLGVPCTLLRHRSQYLQFGGSAVAPHS